RVRPGRARLLRPGLRPLPPPHRLTTPRAGPGTPSAGARPPVPAPPASGPAPPRPVRRPRAHPPLILAVSTGRAPLTGTGARAGTGRYRQDQRLPGVARRCHGDVEVALGWRRGAGGRRP